MKKINFAQACKGIMFLMIGLGFALFGLSTVISNPVKADNPATINNAGKIMMSESGFIFNGAPMYHILVWDTETGKSKLFYYEKGTMVKANYQIPSSPLY